MFSHMYWHVGLLRELVACLYEACADSLACMLHVALKIRALAHLSTQQLQGTTATCYVIALQHLPRVMS